MDKHDGFLVNEVDLARAREEMLAGFGSLDAKRPTAWRAFGYPDTVSFAQLLAAYRRGGPGQGAVHRLLDKCWQERPRIKTAGSEDETPWETKVAALFKERRLWAKLRDLDRRNLVGRYAALIYRVADNLPLREPMQRAARLVDVVPLFEDQIQVTAWHSDETAENYGQPAMFQYRTRPVQGADTQGRPETWIDVHPSRVQILAEGSVGDMFDGVPLLEAGFNALIDLEKITGGSAESYLKNSARTMVFQYEKDAQLQTIAPADGQSGKSVRQVHEEQAKALNRNIDAAIVMKGGTANTLQTQIADPESPWGVAACTFAASVRIPFTILFGQQTGRLASDEDRADFVERCKSRQTNELTPMLEEFVRRMQAAGLIDPGEFEIEWPDIAAPSDDQKLANLGKMADAMHKAFTAGAQGLFTVTELRAAADYEPLEEEAAPVEDDDEPLDDAQPDPSRPAD